MATRAGVATLKVVGSSCSEVHSREGKWAEKGRGGRREGAPWESREEVWPPGQGWSHLCGKGLGSLKKSTNVYNTIQGANVKNLIRNECIFKLNIC